jgi:hypothetical protein
MSVSTDRQIQLSSRKHVGEAVLLVEGAQHPAFFHPQERAVRSGGCLSEGLRVG